MKMISEYEGELLNHVEALYRPGERAIAIELAEALGCAITDTGFRSDAGSTFLAIHPNPKDRNIGNNVFYLSEMTPEQQAVEERLRWLSAEDAGLRDALDIYRSKARGRPFGVPHFALRYASAQAIEDVARRLDESLAPRLKDRLHIRIFRPGDPDGASSKLTQGFLYQDIVVSGAFLLGQSMQLQSN